MNGVSAFGQVRQEARVSKIVRIFSVLAIAAFSVVVSLWSLELLWMPVGDAGIEFSGDTIVAVQPGSPGQIAGLRAGDRFDPKTPFFVRRGVGGSPGQYLLRPAIYSFDVIRNGAAKRVTVSFAPRQGDLAFSGRDAVLYAIAVLVFLISSLIGTAVVLARPSRLTWMFFLFCVGVFVPRYGAAVVLLNLPTPLGFVLNLARGTLFVVGLFAFVDFALRFPNNEARGWKKRVAEVLPLFAIPYWFWSVPVAWIGELYPAPVFVRLFEDTNLHIAVYGTLFLISTFSVLHTYRSSSPQDKQRLKWTFFGITLGFAALTCRDILVLADNLGDVLEMLRWAAVLGAFLAPLTIAYAILKGRVVDVRFVVNRAVAYFLSTALLATAVTTTYWTASVALQHTRIAAFVQLAIAIVLGMVFFQVYRRIDDWIDRTLFKTRYRVQDRLQRIAVRLARAESLQDLEMLLTGEPFAALDLVCGAIYWRSDNRGYVRKPTNQGEPLPKQLQDEEPLIAWLRTRHEPLTLTPSLLRKIGSGLAEMPLALAVPLWVDEMLVAVATYGPHENGTDLDPKEKAAIEALQEPAERTCAKLQRQADTLGRLSALLANAPSDACDELHSYLASQVIDSIPERTRAALLACAAVPQPTCEDVACATEDPVSAELLLEFASRSPIVGRREDGTFVLHALIERVLDARYPDRRREMLVRCAQRSSERDDHVRAASLFERAGLGAAAAQELERSLAAVDPALLIRATEEAADVAEFDANLVKKHPHLWIRSSVFRLFRDAMSAIAKESAIVRNANNIHSAMPSMFDPWCAYLYAESGLFNSAAPLLRAPAIEDNTSFVSEFRRTIASLVAGRLGRLTECGDALDTIVDIHSEECRALKALVRASTVERARGRWNQERAGIDAAIDALTSCRSRFVVWALAEGVAGAWLAGQQRARLSYLKRLDTAVEQFDARAFRHFAAASNAEPVDPAGTESPRWLALAHVMSACSALTWRDAHSHAALALDAAVDAGEPFLQLLARIASAEFDEENRYEHLRQALELSNAIESATLAASVRAFIAHEEHIGVLEQFVGHLREDRDTGGAPLVVELTGGCVRRGAHTIALSERELALALALARSRKSTSNMELAELIWPDLDESAGAHAVQTCMHRLRQRLGDAKAIENTPHGYRLCNTVLIDLPEIESFIQGVKTDEELDELTALRLSALGKQLDRTRPAFMSGWEWFAPFERRIEEWSRVTRQRLATDALRRREYDRALALAQQAIARDELDEPAWELAIRALLESGDRAGAQRELRRYREITLRELNAEPSQELYDLAASVRRTRKRGLRIVGD